VRAAEWVTRSWHRRRALLCCYPKSLAVHHGSTGTSDSSGAEQIAGCVRCHRHSARHCSRSDRRVGLKREPVMFGTCTGVATDQVSPLLSVDRTRPRSPTTCITNANVAFNGLYSVLLCCRVASIEDGAIRRRRKSAKEKRDYFHWHQKGARGSRARRAGETHGRHTG
jgi:hypothetical protein